MSDEIEYDLDTEKDLKSAVIKESKKKLGKLRLACAAVGVSYAKANVWKNEDPSFRARLKEIDEYVKDMLELALTNAAMGGDRQAAMFLLENTAGDRGYGKDSEKKKDKPISDMTAEELEAALAELDEVEAD